MMHSMINLCMTIQSSSLIYCYATTPCIFIAPTSKCTIFQLNKCETISYIYWELYCPAHHKSLNYGTICFLVHEHWLTQIRRHCCMDSLLAKCKYYPSMLTALQWGPCRCIGGLPVSSPIISNHLWVLSTQFVTNSNKFKFVANDGKMLPPLCVPYEPPCILYALFQPMASPFGTSFACGHEGWQPRGSEFLLNSASNPSTGMPCTFSLLLMTDEMAVAVLSDIHVAIKIISPKNIGVYLSEWHLEI